VKELPLESQLHRLNPRSHLGDKRDQEQKEQEEQRRRLMKQDFHFLFHALLVVATKGKMA
jgi:hypothetical protein